MQDARRFTHTHTHTRTHPHPPTHTPHTPAQWFYFDSIESLPSEPLPSEEVAPLVRWLGVARGVAGG